MSVFENSKIAGQKIMDFVHNFCFAFRDEIWAVHAKHYAFIEKNGLISHNNSALVSVFELLLMLSADVVRLLGIVETFGTGFGFCKSYLFFLDIENPISVYIGV
ncbi:hypothetical protein G9A89_002087 [Geosiphon pyriformis]|nr:hypothetical protein G9A89_002087 [Geosiphon pyriformis]